MRVLAKSLGGGRTWWAHFEFTRINTAPTFLPKKIEDLREAVPTAYLSGSVGVIPGTSAPRHIGARLPMDIPNEPCYLLCNVQRKA
jgi:hypothetical protein